MNYLDEFDRQVQNLLSKNYPGLTGLTPEEFVQLLSPLKQKLSDIQFEEIDFEQGKLPFVIVVESGLIKNSDAMSSVLWNEKSGTTKLDPLTPEDFKVIDGVEIPTSPVYLLINIDRGKETINVPPSEAMKLILSEKNIPLTIAEGIAIITHFPQFLIKNNCFSLLASRHPGDKRVPAIWINSNKQPNLGWCWDGNPHTWLGNASAKLRISTE